MTKTQKVSLEKQVVKPKKKEKKTNTPAGSKALIHEAFEHLLAWRGSSPLGSGSSHPEEGAWGYPLPLSPPSPLAQVNTSFSEFYTFIVFYFAKVLFKIFFISVHIYLELFIIHLGSPNHFCE